AVEDVSFPGVLLDGRDDLERLAAHGYLAGLVVTVAAGRPGTGDFPDVAAVDVTVGIGKVADLEARLGRYGGQERLGLARGDEHRVERDRLLQAAPALVSERVHLLHVTVEYPPVVSVAVAHD